MKEAAQVNALVYIIQAYDPDGDTLEFAFSGGYKIKATCCEGSMYLDNYTGNLSFNMTFS